MPYSRVEEQAARELWGQRLLQHRVPVAGEEGSVAEREVDVLVAVPIPHVGAAGALHHQRMGLVELEAGGDAERQHPLGARHRPLGGRRLQDVFDQFGFPRPQPSALVITMKWHGRVASSGAGKGSEPVST